MGNDNVPNFDTNTWYQITESRVDFNSSLQLESTDTTSMFMGAACESCLQYWQIIPSTFDTQQSSNGSFVFRNQATGTTSQLGTCAAPNENDSSRTQPCMLRYGGGRLAGPFTKWDITTWSTDGDLKITHVGNGTDYNLDCHKGNPLFMSSTTAPQPKQPAQHWLFSSIGVINDQTYSTGIPPGPSSSSSSSSSSGSSSATSSSATSSPASTSSSSPSSSSKSGLSPGAAAGIGVGVGLVALLAILLGLLFFWRRRKRNRNTESPPTYGENASGSNMPLNERDYGQIDHKYGEVEDGPRYEMNGIATAEMGSGQNPVAELPGTQPGVKCPSCRRTCCPERVMNFCAFQRGN